MNNDEYGLCDAQKFKYLRMKEQKVKSTFLNQNLESSSKREIAAGSQQSSLKQSFLFQSNPNENLIKNNDWNNDIKLNREQNLFLRIYQKRFLDLDIWDPDNHEVHFYL